MFVCGPTIQDYMHVGHARTYLFYDMLARYLSYLGNKVEFVINITDIDAGIVKGSQSAGSSIEQFTAKYETAFVSDMKSLGIGSVQSYDRVSEYIQEMTRQVEGLLSNGHAYKANGSVYFSVDSFPDFGRLSRQSPYQLSLRPLEIAEGKKNQTDFSLWRASGDEEQKWDSPWGRGTPGWHVQDTAVSFSRFGAQYDIHGGARELVYPHHEAEIAQLESLTGVRPAVRYWVHTGLLTQRREKMAKSKGNVMWVRDAVRDFGPDAMRLYLLSMHHTKDAEFSEKALKKWREVHSDTVDNVKVIQQRSGESPHGHSKTASFLRLMDDDLQARRAIDYLLAEVRKGARDSDPSNAAGVIELVGVAASVLGVTLIEAVN